jgi:uncharacterized NAD(P)/FAD-binding protein YdhS/folate-dependent phosphoribosylglycinamide formyltransferase PurN
VVIHHFVDCRYTFSVTTIKMRLTRVAWPFGFPRRRNPQLGVAANKLTSLSKVELVNTLHANYITVKKNKEYHERPFFRPIKGVTYSPQPPRSYSLLTLPDRSTTSCELSVPDLPALLDLVIVGGGACGVAVAIQIIARVKKGKPVRSISLVEKNKSFGPGLAYSEACSGTILNMKADTMGLYPNKPEHYSQWMKAHIPGLKQNLFPPREQYGQYLAFLVQSIAEEAERLGVVFRAVKGEALDLVRVGRFLELALDDGTKLRARDVVLALGNFPAAIHKELSGTHGYIRSPWPNNRLKEIPPDVSVCIFGSRLTAIDTGIFLAENGHRGPITFISRSGRLPKVQGATSPFDRRYALNCLARDVEGSPNRAFFKVMQGIQEEIDRTNAIDWCKVKTVYEPLAELRSDITKAESGAIPWQAVINATAPLVERYWSCFSSRDKETFLRDHSSSWVTYRHAMPLENARKILALMEQGQLRVVRGGRVRSTSSEFMVISEGAEIRSRFLIEAIGQEYDPYQIDSPLLQRLLSSELVKSHPAGGISVDFSTLAATKGIYVIGSMTRGVHFYTSAIDRNAAHAERIADDLTGEPIRRPLHIAFFVGSDLFSHLMLSKLVSQLIAFGHTPFVFLPSDRVNKKPKAFDLRELSFFERQLLQEHVIPFCGSSPRQGAAFLTVEQMRYHHGILVKNVDNVNEPSFLELLRSHHIDVGISLRCYQRFKKDILQYFSSPRVLLNLHPGVLPSYRGVITAIRAMMNGEREFGYSLHHVNEDYDSGDILDIRTHPIDYKKSMLQSMEDVHQIGIDMVMDAMDRVARGKPLPAFRQDAAKGRYHTFPSEEELENCRRSGIRLVDSSPISDLIIRSFASPDDEDALREIIEKATREWYNDEVQRRSQEIQGKQG